jgi:hypothetical protein
MPTSAEILEGLAEITQRWRTLAVVWHIYYGILAAGLLFGMRPSKPIAGILLAIPLFSVSTLAWATANPFNGTLFAVLGLALAGISLTLPREPIATGSSWAIVAGVAMFAFGWVYPHFLDASTSVEYLYAAPTGLIPCPTLSITIGLALLTGGLDSRLWSLVLAGAGLFYGAFGAWRLGVTIDLALLFGAVALIGAVLLPKLPVQAASSGGQQDMEVPARESRLEHG